MDAERIVRVIGAGALIRNAIKLQAIGQAKPGYGTRAEEVVQDQIDAWAEKGYAVVEQHDEPVSLQSMAAMIRKVKEQGEQIAAIESRLARYEAYYTAAERLIWHETEGVSHADAYEQYRPARAAIDAQEPRP